MMRMIVLGGLLSVLTVPAASWMQIVTADAGYHSEANLKGLYERAVPALIADGLMRRREASINDVHITEATRLYRWPLGPRPDDHPGLSSLGL